MVRSVLTINEPAYVVQFKLVATASISEEHVKAVQREVYAFVEIPLGLDVLAQRIVKLVNAHYTDVLEGTEVAQDSPLILVVTDKSKDPMPSAVLVYDAADESFNSLTGLFIPVSFEERLPMQVSTQHIVDLTWDVVHGKGEIREVGVCVDPKWANSNLRERLADNKQAYQNRVSVLPFNAQVHITPDSFEITFSNALKMELPFVNYSPAANWYLAGRLAMTQAFYKWGMSSLVMPELAPEPVVVVRRKVEKVSGKNVTPDDVKVKMLDIVKGKQYVVMQIFKGALRADAASKPSFGDRRLVAKIKDVHLILPNSFKDEAKIDVARKAARWFNEKYRD
jgi:hypothetical protein